MEVGGRVDETEEVKYTVISFNDVYLCLCQNLDSPLFAVLSHSFSFRFASQLQDG